MMIGRCRVIRLAGILFLLSACLVLSSCAQRSASPGEESTVSRDWLLAMIESAEESLRAATNGEKAEITREESLTIGVPQTTQVPLESDLPAAEASKDSQPVTSESVDAVFADTELSQPDTTKVPDPLPVTIPVFSDTTVLPERATTPEPFPETVQVVPDTTALSDTQAAETMEPSGESVEAVYWTKSGSVWHIDPDCSSLRNARQVLSGSVAEAQAAGKPRVCKRCGGTSTNSSVSLDGGA